ncbi:MAG: LL-diaminopimelate aminotransferase [Deltaproteobacteria bacterium]|nr:MAG: LL-diaminopimelate aminotransferase [Deltaproteobacteria bacterium]
MDLARRLRALPPYLFAELDRKKEALLKKGVDVIDLGVGDPDLPTPKRVVERMREAVLDPSNHRYPSYEGLREFREAAARWYLRRFGVELDPSREVMALIGSKEGIAHIPLAFVNPGDGVLVPDPGYPVYSAATILAGGTPHPIPLLEERGFLPDLQAIPKDVAKGAKLLFLNYPNNPTSAVASKGFFEEVVAFAKEFDLIVCHDAAYSELYFESPPPSFLEAEGAKEVGVEFHSLSKTYRMTGWRIGFVVGSEDVIRGLRGVKTNVDSGVFQAIQIAAIEALEGDQRDVEEGREIFRRRRDLMLKELGALGLEVFPSPATFYLWVKVPQGHTSTSFCELVLLEAGVVFTPGVGFGKYGEGYVRIALTVGEERLEEALERLKKVPL